MTRYDAIVLGLGAAGSAALYQLAKRGAKVLGIDRYAPPHDHGSSHGETRITRLAIGEGAHYTPLAMRSHEIWRALEAESGRELMRTTGGLIISSAHESKATLHVTNFFDNTVAAARSHGIAHEILDAATIRQRFPAFAVKDDEIGYYEAETGFLRPEACIAVQLDLARKHGAEIRNRTAAQRFDAATSHVAVTIGDEVLLADKLIVAAGAWLPELLEPELAALFRVYRQVLVWFDPGDAHAQFEPGRFPVFIWEVQGATEGIYGFPAIDGPRGGVKVATEQYDATTTPDAAPREITSQEIGALHASVVAPHFPALSARCLKIATCLYTVTPDAGFVIDTHPASERVILASPCSGHGFKHSAALGEVLADLAQQGRSPFDISAFRLSRFIKG